MRKINGHLRRVFPCGQRTAWAQREEPALRRAVNVKMKYSQRKGKLWEETRKCNVSVRYHLLTSIISVLQIL